MSGGSVYALWLLSAMIVACATLIAAVVIVAAEIIRWAT